MNDGLTREQFDELYQFYLDNPDVYIKEVLGSNLWDMQREIVQATFKYSNVAVKTCNSIGKSYVAARIAVTYLMLHPNSIVVTTAPTWRQVTDVLWREIGNTVKMAKYKLTDEQVNQAGLNLDTKWYAVGVSTSSPDNMMGYHADNLLVIVDEAGGVDDLIYRGVKAITTNVNNKVLLIGNPTTPGGVFWEAFEPNSMYKQYTVRAFDTPNLTSNGIDTLDKLIELFTPPPNVDKIDHFNQVRKSLKSPFPELIDAGTVYQRYLEWGVDSPAWESLIMGEFPSQAAQSLIPINLVDQAMNNYGIDEETGKSFAELSGWYIPDGKYEYGIDMARFGSDNTVFTPRHGGFVEQQVIWGKVDLIESADRVLKLIDPYKESIIKIDDTGNGGGTTDALARYRQLRTESQGRAPYNYRLSAYNMSSSPIDKDKFADITSEIYWNLRDWFVNKQIALPYDAVLRSELISRRWSISPSGKIKVESKDEYRKRTGGKSPDRSDALALAFASDISQRHELKRQSSQTPADREAYRPSVTPVTAGMGKW